jgi:hypothetical protein
MDPAGGMNHNSSRCWLTIGGCLNGRKNYRKNFVEKIVKKLLKKYFVKKLSKIRFKNISRKKSLKIH